MGVSGQAGLDDLHGYSSDGYNVFGCDIVVPETFVIMYGPLFGPGRR